MNWLALAPWLIAAVCAIGGFTGYEIERGNYQAEVAARAEDKAAAEKAKADALAKANALSDELVIAQAAAMAVTEKTVTVYRDRIIHAPSTSTCGPAVRDAARGVLDTLHPGGGQAAPVGGAP